MLISELQSLLDKLSLPCTFSELMTQCELNCIHPDMIKELCERFQEEYSEDDELIDESSFDELENYFDEEFYRQDE
jgi:gamma-glutamyl-gamma-aminobutyrate hydrolase PuuD